MLTLVQIYACFFLVLRKALGIQIPGLGFLLRRLRRPFFFQLLGQEMYFEPRAASSYGLHVIGRMQEPETHKFLNQVFDAVGVRQAWFIEVGANVGAFLLDLCRRANVQSIAFEPCPPCVNAIVQTMARNGRFNCKVFPQLVGDAPRQVPFRMGRHDGSASVLTSANSREATEQVCLDHHPTLSQIPPGAPTVLMIDVEGYEPRVLGGGLEFIQEVRPLIVFEYNDVSRRHFHLDCIQAMLGKNYRIYRLGRDGLLDHHTDQAWNCVAVPIGTIFEEHCKKIIRVSKTALSPALDNFMNLFFGVGRPQGARRDFAVGAS